MVYSLAFWVSIKIIKNVSDDNKTQIKQDKRDYGISMQYTRVEEDVNKGVGFNSVVPSSTWEDLHYRD